MPRIGNKNSHLLLGRATDLALSGYTESSLDPASNTKKQHPSKKKLAKFQAWNYFLNTRDALYCKKTQNVQTQTCQVKYREIKHFTEGFTLWHFK